MNYINPENPFWKDIMLWPTCNTNSEQYNANILTSHTERFKAQSILLYYCVSMFISCISFFKQ